MLLFFEKSIFPSMSKTAEFGKKTQGILGVKVMNVFPSPFKLEW
jgi:hypothetical protein